MDSPVLTDPSPASTSPAESPLAASRRFEFLVVLGILLALLMGALDNFVVVTALPKILGDFQQLNSGTFVVSGYVIGSAAGIPIFSKLSDLNSRRNVFLGGLAIFIGGSILAGLSQNLSELIAFRTLQGFGSGDFFPVGIAIVAVSFPPATRARIIGLLSGVFGIAVVAGPLLGSAIVDHTSWRWVFYVNIPVGLIGFGVIASTLPALRPANPRPFDALGAGLLVAWVAALMFPLYQVSGNGWSWVDLRVEALLASATILAVLFVLWELRASEPLVPLRLFTHRVLSAGGTTTFLIGMVFFPLATFLSLVVGVVLAQGAANAADIVRDVLYALVIPLVFGAVVGGQLRPRLSYRVVVVMGLLIASVGLIGLTGLTPSTPTWQFAFGILPVGGIILPLIPLGFGVGMTFPVFLLAAQNEVPTGDVGEAGGLIQFLQTLGGAIGLSVLASFQLARLNVIDPTPNSTCSSPTPALPACLPYLTSLKSSLIISYVQTFEVLLGLLFIALLISLFLKGRLPQRQNGGTGTGVGIG